MTNNETVKSLGSIKASWKTPTMSLHPQCNREYAATLLGQQMRMRTLLSLDSSVKACL